MPTREAEADRVTSRWNITTFGEMLGGMDTSRPRDSIDEINFPDAENIVIRDGEVRVDTGYTTLGIDAFDSSHQLLYGVPRLPFEFVDNAGNRSMLLVTDDTLYILAADGSWRIVSRGVSSTLAVATTGGEGTITLADASSFNDPGRIGIFNDAGAQVVRAVTGIVGNVVTLDTALPSPFVASIGNSVIDGPLYAGSVDESVVGVTVPSHEYFVFTNGVDNLQRYDGTDVTDLAGIIADVNVTAVKTLTLFKNYLVIGNFTEGGNRQPNKVRWSDTGDPEEWLTGNAGFRFLFDTSDPIVAMAPLGDDNIIYRATGAVSRQELIGALTLLFNFRTIIYAQEGRIGGIGALSANAVFPRANSHLIMASDGIHEYVGGFNFRTISNRAFKGFFDAAGEISKTIAHRSFVQYIDEFDEVYFFYPSTSATTYPDSALILNLRVGSIVKRRFAREFTAAGARVGTEVGATYNDLVGTMIEQEWTAISSSISGLTPRIILAGVDKKTYEYDFLAGAEAGTSISWYIETGERRTLDVEDLYDRFDFNLAGDSVTVSYSVDGGMGWVSLGTFSPGASAQAVRAFSQFVSERVSLRFSGTGGGLRIGRIAAKHRPASRWS